jgi:thiol-disulfide isomerase/thioredoxin
MIKKKKQLRSVFALLVCCAAIGLHTCTPNDTRKDAIGWTLQNNEHRKLSDYKGKLVILDFYATYCEPCRQETPHLVQLQEQYAPQGLQVIGLNVGGQDDHAKIPAYAKEFGIKYPLGLPDDAFVEKYLGDNENIPQAFVFDRDGQLVKRFVGYNEDVDREIERIIQVYVSSNK